MTLEEGLMIFFIILGVYFSVVLVLKKKGLMEKYHLSLWGPAIMWRTEKGRKLIDRIARRKRFWRGYANAGIVVCFILMILMLFLLLSTLPIILEQDETIVSSNPQLIIGLPGLNPIIPLWYGILGFIVALAVHEFSHGILSRVGDIKVKSLGLLYFIVPIGAFCEPDEKALQKTSNKKRMRVFAAGPMSNVVTAFICIGLISVLMSVAVQPAAEGVGVFSTVQGLPADDVGLQPGMIITSINNTTITSVADFQQVMQMTAANQTVELSYIYGGESYAEYIQLADKYQIAYQAMLDQYGEVNTSLLADFVGKGYLGASVTTQFKQDLQILKNPFASFPFSFLYYISFPLLGLLDGYSPLISPFCDYFVTADMLPAPVFWGIISILYWVFWINFMLATFNVLPMVPLDGGYMLRDAIDSMLKKIKANLSDEKREKIIHHVSLVISLLVLAVILAPILLPHIRGLF